MDKRAFLAEFDLSDADLMEANITWEELLRIENAYRAMEQDLREIGKSFIDEYLYDIDTAGIHSYRYRTKGVAQLLEKVIRKRREDPVKFAALDHTNFHKFVTDLVSSCPVFSFSNFCSFCYQVFNFLWDFVCFSVVEQGLAPVSGTTPCPTKYDLLPLWDCE